MTPEEKRKAREHTLKQLEILRQEEGAKPKPERKKRGKNHESTGTDWQEVLRFFGK